MFTRVGRPASRAPRSTGRPSPRQVTWIAASGPVGVPATAGQPGRSALARSADRFAGAAATAGAAVPRGQTAMVTAAASTTTTSSHLVGRPHRDPGAGACPPGSVTPDSRPDRHGPRPAPARPWPGNPRSPGPSPVPRPCPAPSGRRRPTGSPSPAGTPRRPSAGVADPGGRGRSPDGRA